MFLHTFLKIRLFKKGPHMGGQLKRSAVHDRPTFVHRYLSGSKCWPVNLTARTQKTLFNDKSNTHFGALCRKGRSLWICHIILDRKTF